MRVTSWGLLGLLGLILGAAGCAKPPRPEPVAVAGTARDHRDKPLRQLLLRFHPQEEKNKAGPAQPALTKDDGSFEVKLWPGRYKVTVSSLPVGVGAHPGAAPTTTPGATTPPAVPPGYDSVTGSPWEIDVPGDGKRDVVLQVRAR